MPKMKTKSSAKKRFKLTSGGKVKFFGAYMRHNATKRSGRMKRANRGGRIMSPGDAKLVTKHWLPTG